MLKVRPWLVLWILILGELTRAVPVNADARLAIIIDDIGYNKVQSERAAQLNGNFTLSILPFTPHGLSCAKIAHNLGKELMLHIPMSAVSNMPVGKGGLTGEMSKEEFVSTVRMDLDSVPYIQGVNNHMGSRLTQETQPMQWLMTELQERGLYFVDSRTSAQTKALDIAHELHIPSLRRNVFLDDINDTKAILYQLNQALQLARQHGSAVAIGHPYPATLSVLEDIQPLLSAQNVKLVYVSALLKSAPQLEASSSPEPPPKPKEPGFCRAPSPDFMTKLRTGVDLYDNATLARFSYFGY